MSLLSSDLVAKDHALEEVMASTRTIDNVIQMLTDKSGIRVLHADIHVVVTRRPHKPAADDPDAAATFRLPATTGSVIVRLARRESATNILHTRSGPAHADSSPTTYWRARCCTVRLLRAHLS